jgi:hypothetical protein
LKIHIKANGPGALIKRIGNRGYQREISFQLPPGGQVEQGITGKGLPVYDIARCISNARDVLPAHEDKAWRKAEPAGPDIASRMEHDGGNEFQLHVFPCFISF